MFREFTVYFSDIYVIIMMIIIENYAVNILQEDINGFF